MRTFSGFQLLNESQRKTNTCALSPSKTASVLKDQPRIKNKDKPFLTNTTLLPPAASPAAGAAGSQQAWTSLLKGKV